MICNPHCAKAHFLILHMWYKKEDNRHHYSSIAEFEWWGGGGGRGAKKGKVISNVRDQYYISDYFGHMRFLIHYTQ